MDKADSSNQISVDRRAPTERQDRFEELRALLAAEGHPADPVDSVSDGLEQMDVELRDSVAPSVMDALAGWTRDHRNTLFELPFGMTEQMIVEFVVGYLVAQGLLLSPAVGAPRPVGWQEAVPEHLRPDMATQLRLARQQRAELVAERTARRHPGVPLGEWPTLNPGRLPHPADRKEGSG